MRFVIADDMHTPRAILARILSEAGHVVAGEARNGREAIALVREQKPDAVIFDISMPIMQGNEAARALRPEFPDMLIFVASNVTIGRSELEAELDAHFVTKPYRPEYLLQEINRVIARE